MISANGSYGTYDHVYVIVSFHYMCLFNKVELLKCAIAWKNVNIE